MGKRLESLQFCFQRQIGFSSTLYWYFSLSHNPRYNHDLTSSQRTYCKVANFEMNGFNCWYIFYKPGSPSGYVDSGSDSDSGSEVSDGEEGSDSDSGSGEVSDEAEGSDSGSGSEEGSDGDVGSDSDSGSDVYSADGSDSDSGSGEEASGSGVGSISGSGWASCSVVLAGVTVSSPALSVLPWGGVTSATMVSAGSDVTFAMQNPAARIR